MFRLLLTAAALTAVAGSSVAQAPSPGAGMVAAPTVTAPSSVTTSRGAGLVTGGTAGSAQSVMIPGSPVNGMLLNNGNGTSTIMIPGGPSQVISTPR